MIRITQRNIRYLILPIIAITLLVTGCKSTRNTVRASKNDKQSSTIINRDPEFTKRMKADERLLVDEAMTWLGTPYRYGGKDYKGTDCSGMTMQVYNKALGIAIPRNSAEQQKFCKTIKKGALSPGDLVFFCTGKNKSRVSHVGIYIGQGQFIHSSSSKGVIISSIDERYYTSNYHSSGYVARTSSKYSAKAKPEKAPSPKAKTPKKKQPKKVKAKEPEKKPLETEPLHFEIDRVIEEKIDSIYSDFLD